MLQHGGAEETQPTPWETIPPWESEEGVDQSLNKVYEDHVGIILSSNQTGAIDSIYNFPLTNNFTVEQLETYLDTIYLDQGHSFKINLAFGFVLVNTDTGA